MKSKYLVWTLLIFSLTACVQTEERIIKEYIDKQNENSWKEHSEINYGEKYILNANANEDYLTFHGDWYFTKVDKNNDAHTYIFIYDNHDYKLPISNDIFFFFSSHSNENGYMQFYYLPKLGSENSDKARIQFTLSDYDSTFHDFDPLDETYNIPLGAFNSNHQLLLPYSVGIIDSLAFALISFKINPDINTDLSSNDTYIEIKDVKIIKIHRDNSPKSSIVYGTGNDFIIRNNNKVAKIYSNGSYKEIKIHGFFPSKFFIKNNYLLAVCYGTIYLSYDNGETWIKEFESNGGLDMFSYATIDDRVIMSKESSIYEMVFTDTGFVAEELKNDGLEGNFITSVNEFNNKVYISTLSGLFYKNKAEFFDRK